MAFLCQVATQDSSTGQLIGTQCVETTTSGFLPPLTTEEKNEILLWMLAIFFVVFTVKQIRKMLGS